MGTNYYYRKRPCKTCGHSDIEYHIGKSSGGWQFSFQPLHEAKSWKEWQLVLNDGDGEIYDEYGRKVSFKDFKKLIEDKQQNSELNHAKCHPENSWVDEDGYAFCDYDFS